MAATYKRYNKFPLHYRKVLTLWPLPTQVPCVSNHYQATMSTWLGGGHCWCLICHLHVIARLTCWFSVTHDAHILCDFLVRDMWYQSPIGETSICFQQNCQSWHPVPQGRKWSKDWSQHFKTLRLTSSIALIHNRLAIVEENDQGAQDLEELC